MSAIIVYKAPPLLPVIDHGQFSQVHRKLACLQSGEYGVISLLLQIQNQAAILRICRLHIGTKSLGLLLRSRDETCGSLALGRVAFQPCAQPSIVSIRPSSSCPSVLRVSFARQR
jgi:hypothetical protein